eukprot:5423557-Prymnesium_polylepis.1
MALRRLFFSWFWQLPCGAYTQVEASSEHARALTSALKLSWLAGAQRCGSKRVDAADGVRCFHALA